MVDLCPHLKELRVVRVRIISSPTIFDPVAFFDHLAQQCPRLRRLHFSMAHARYSRFTESDLVGIFDHNFLGLKEVSFMDAEMLSSDDTVPMSPLASWLQTWRPHEEEQSVERSTSIPLLQSPKRCPNQVTWLELTGTRSLRLFKKDGPVIHQFLCNSPHLQHLMALNFAIHIESLDVNGVMKEPSDHRGFQKNTPTTQHNTQLTPSLIALNSLHPQNPLSSPTGAVTINNHSVWACRRLRTLHIGFEACEEDSDKSREDLIVFGYLGRICPDLENLHIRRRSMDLRRYGGLCLLSRLRRLEKLILDCEIIQTFKLSDLKWIKRQSDSSDFILPRFWKRLQSTMDIQPKKLKQQKHQQQQHDDQVAIDMTNVGRDMDLVNWKIDRQQEAKRLLSCWPCLESFQVRYKGPALWNNRKKPDFQSLRRDAHIDVLNTHTLAN
ncbi:hypothetical protein BGX31_001003 [Mortierella sp. GBA43]|nr:hypothetical protein BGX31_001003 [Mortierella sp. GBA43]